jgi:hypothetical protein
MQYFGVLVGEYLLLLFFNSRVYSTSAFIWVGTLTNDHTTSSGAKYSFIIVKASLTNAILSPFFKCCFKAAGTSKTALFHIHPI